MGNKNLTRFSASRALICALLLPLLSTAIELKIETTREGPVCSRRSRNGDKLTMNYRGVFQDGREFDSSYGKSAFEFILGTHQVIRGWDMGLLNMCIGEQRKLTIPPNLAYGRSGSGAIPPNSILIFDTELLSIAGVTETIPEVSPENPSESPAENTPSPSSEESSKTSFPTTAAADIDSPTASKSQSNGECKLLGKFAILVQSALGGLALLSLVWKRYREQPRRPLKVWSFDVSKQVFGSVMVHFANLFLSLLSAGRFGLQSSTSTVVQNAIVTLKDGATDMPNPCSFYLLNLAIDTTVGIPILVLLLRVFHAVANLTPLANPPESLKSGNYGSPPRFGWWAKQAILYFMGLMGMKFIVFLMFQFFPGLGWVGDWALRWTEGKEWVQITFVMLIFPLIMNVVQYWIIDSFIKDKGGDYSYEGVRTSDDGLDQAEEEEHFIRRHVDDDDDGEADIPSGYEPHGVPIMGENGKMFGHSGAEAARIKESNPLPLPIEFENDLEEPRGRKKKD